jgi:predicted AAA+ superfamily ATPase
MDADGMRFLWGVFFTTKGRFFDRMIFGGMRFPVIFGVDFRILQASIAETIDRNTYLDRLETALRRAPVVALLGPRQCGKTTLAHMVSEKGNTDVYYFDLESPQDLTRLQNPEMVLGEAVGLVIIDEIQEMPELFSLLRSLVDRRSNQAVFLVLGSASPLLVKGAAESLAGRIEFVDIAPFDITELGYKNLTKLWFRGGFPRSYLAADAVDSFAWREGFIRTFLQRDLPQLGISIPAPAMRRFWTMLAHYHGQTWNASAISRSMGLSDKTVRSYLDILTETYMIRQLQPWFINTGKRQVKAPKIYFRDTGILHSLLSLNDGHSVMGHPKVGASWEGFALEQIVRTKQLDDTYFWSTYSGGEVDLIFESRGKRYGVEFKFSEAPKISPMLKVHVEMLGLEHLWVVCPCKDAYPVTANISVANLKSFAGISI